MHDLMLVETVIENKHIYILSEIQNILFVFLFNRKLFEFLWRRIIRLSSFLSLKLNGSKMMPGINQNPTQTGRSQHFMIFPATSEYPTITQQSRRASSWIYS